MAKKRIMHKFRMDEISPVDRPAQGPALAVIMKNDKNVAKGIFKEVLDGMVTERKINEALSEMWDLNWALRETIEKIVEDREKYPNTLDAVREVLSEFVLAVSSMVADAIGEVQEAVDGEGDDFNKFLATDYAFVPESDPSIRKLRLTNEPGGNPDPMMVEAVAIALDKGFHGHKVNIPEDDRSTVINRVRKAWEKANPDKDETHMPEVIKGLKEDDPMSKQEDKNTPNVEEIQKNLEAATARAERAEAIAEMTDVQKSYFNELDDEGKTAYIAKSADDRQTDVEKAAESNKVVYLSDSGEEFRKNDDPRLVKMAKDRDEDRKIAKKERQARETLELTKRADDELSNLPGDAETKVAMLKAIDGIEDDATREKIGQLIKAGNDAQADVFKADGTGVAPSDSNEGQLDSLAKAYAEKHDVTIEKAYNEVLKTDDGKALYDQSQS